MLKLNEVYKNTKKKKGKRKKKKKAINTEEESQRGRLKTQLYTKLWILHVSIDKHIYI